MQPIAQQQATCTKKTKHDLFYYESQHQVSKLAEENHVSLQQEQWHHPTGRAWQLHIYMRMSRVACMGLTNSLAVHRHRLDKC
jgi:hypothetical protein